jgi:hypothetical protein
MMPKPVPRFNRQECDDLLMSYFAFLGGRFI